MRTSKFSVFPIFPIFLPISLILTFTLTLTIPVTVLGEDRNAFIVDDRKGRDRLSGIMDRLGPGSWRAGQGGVQVSQPDGGGRKSEEERTWLGKTSVGSLERGSVATLQACRGESLGTAHARGRGAGSPHAAAFSVARGAV